MPAADIEIPLLTIQESCTISKRPTNRVVNTVVSYTDAYVDIPSHLRDDELVDLVDNVDNLERILLARTSDATEKRELVDAKNAEKREANEKFSAMLRDIKSHAPDRWPTP